MIVGHFPAPTTAPPAEILTEQEFRIDTHDWPDYSPQFESGFPYTFVGPMACRGTDEEFYALVEKFTVDHAMIVMHAGRVDEALSDRVAPTGGNPELARELRERGIRFEDFLSVYTTERGHRFLNSPEAVRSEKGQRALDAAQYRGLPGARRLRQMVVGNGHGELSVGFETGVRYGSVRLSDIIAIGDEETHTDYSLFNDIMRAIVRGEGKASAEEIGALLVGMMNSEPYFRCRHHQMWARIAHRYGAQFARTIRHPEAAYLVWDVATGLEDREAEQSFLAFYHALVSPADDSAVDAWGEEPPFPPNEALIIWGSGVSAALAKAALATGMSPHEVAAVHGEGVASAVSDGWL